MYIDSVGSGSPMDMETDGPMLDDVNMLKKTVEEEATQVKPLTEIFCHLLMSNIALVNWCRPI